MHKIIKEGFLLRNFIPDDKESLAKHANNPQIARNLRNAFPHPYTIKDAEDWINLSIISIPKAHFAIATENECIGGIGLTLMDDIFVHSAELGFWISEEFWGKGIITLAAKEMISYGFSELQLKRIFAYAFSTNPGSIRVLEKIGMQYECTQLKGAFKNGIYFDLAQYAITCDV